MANDKLALQLAQRVGCIAALDQSGGSSPEALRHYGVPEAQFAEPAAMFDAMHAMRTRIMQAPAFTGTHVIGAILFEDTMNREVAGAPVPRHLWERGIIPLVKVDQGLEPEADGVSLMKPMPRLDEVLGRAAQLGVLGTKMRSTIHEPNATGIRAIVDQQFAVAVHIADFGIVPIVEAEVLITDARKAECEAMLHAELVRAVGTLRAGQHIALKLTLPEQPDLYRDLAQHPHVAKLLALSGGYTRAEGCRRLAQNHDMVASFSRALVEDLRYSMTDGEFQRALATSIDQIYRASTEKTVSL